MGGGGEGGGGEGGGEGGWYSTTIIHRLCASIIGNNWRATLSMLDATGCVRRYKAVRGVLFYSQGMFHVRLLLCGETFFDSHLKKKKQLSPSTL